MTTILGFESSAKLVLAQMQMQIAAAIKNNDVGNNDVGNNDVGNNDVGNNDLVDIRIGP